MKIVVSENSFKKILLKLKEQVFNINEVDKAKGEPEFPNAPKAPEGKYNPNVVINWETERSLRLPRPDQSAGKFSIAKYLQKDPSTKRIAYVIKNSTSTLYDRESWAELAFYYIKDMNRYNEVKKYLGQDPFKFVQKFADVSKKYYVQPMAVTMKQIYQEKGKGKGKKTTDISKIKTSTPQDLNKLYSDIVQKCGTLSSKNPSGKKHNTNGINIYKKWVNDKAQFDKPTDKLLYKWGGIKWYAKVPSDFGWKYYNEVYPFPKYFSRECIDLAKKFGPAYKNKKKVEAEGAYNTYKYSPERRNIEAKHDPYMGMQPLDPKMQDVEKKVSHYTKLSGNYYAQMMLNFNKDLAKQKELIPKYCTTPLTRENTDTRYREGLKLHMISMYELCKGLGGLWVYGVGTANFSCGCRDNSHPQLTVQVKTDTGVTQASTNIQKQQGSRDWTHPQSAMIIADVAQIATSFIPVVGWAISMGIGIAKTGYYFNKGDQLRGAIELMFSMVPALNNTQIGQQALKSVKDAVVAKTALSVDDLDTLNKVLDYDQVSTRRMEQYWLAQAKAGGKVPTPAQQEALKNFTTTAEQQFHSNVIGFDAQGGRKKLAVATGETAKNNKKTTAQKI